MSNFTFRFRNLFLSLLLVGAAAGTGAAQSQMQATQYQNNRTYRTASPELAVDDLLSTAATVTPTLIGAGALRVTFPTTVQPGQQASLVIKSSTSLATVLGGMGLRTYSTTNQNPDQPIQALQLDDPATIQVTVAQSDATAKLVKFTATQAFNQLELGVGSLLNTNYSVDVFAVFATVSPLPVQLTAFSGKATATGVALNWETASEQHNDYFVVERADSSPDNFQALSLVKGAGTSAQSHQYQFVDATPGGLRYYRLRQVDVDGKESFSPVVAVKAELTALVAYPSVATETLTVLGTTGTRLGIFDQMGQQVQIADLSATQAPQVDVRSLPSGVYFLRDVATGQSTRFVKSNGR